MAGIARVREYFHEIGTTFNKMYVSGKLKGLSKMFVNEGYPDADTFKDLFASIIFKKNVEADRAGIQDGGLIRLATREEAKTRLNESASNKWPNVLQPGDIPLFGVIAAPHTFVASTILQETGTDSEDGSSESITKDGISLMSLSIPEGGPRGRVLITISAAIADFLKFDEFGRIAVDVVEREIQYVSKIDYTESTRNMIVTYSKAKFITRSAPEESMVLS